MSDFLKEQRDYLRDNPEGYWFKAKLYGWGWTPVRWEGWLVIGIFVGLVIVLATRVGEYATLRELVWPFFIPLFVLLSALITICYKKGEKPRWQWGPPKKQNNS